MQEKLYGVKGILAVASAVVAVSCASARTVAWWHLNEGATILNAVDSSKLALKAGVLNNSNALVSGKDEYLPVYANAFPDYATWLVPGGAKGTDNRGMYFRPQTGDGASGYGSVLYTAVTDDLKLPSVTVELFVRSDYTSIANHWKNLIVMGGPGAQDV